MGTTPDPEPTDAALLAALDGDSFSVLFERHSEAVLAYFMRRVDCAETAADLTAETFAAAFSSRRRFRDTGAPGRAWLFTIARRQLSHFIRREQVADRARRRLGVPPPALSPDDLERIESLVDSAGDRARIRGALDELPVTQSEAVRLRVAEDLSYAELAAAVGCTEGAARVRVCRGLTRLADAMETT